MNRSEYSANLSLHPTTRPSWMAASTCKRVPTRPTLLQRILRLFRK